MQRVLTDAFLRSLTSPASGRAEIGDTRCGGLVLRITEGGIKSWSFRYRDRETQKQTRVTIGGYPTIGLAAAREAADTFRKTVAAGGNPAQTKRQRTGAARTFGAMAERYLEEHARRKKRSHAADERNLKKHVLPKWKNRASASIKRADVIELVEGLIAAGKQTLANRVQSVISSVFTFGMDAAIVEFNPCHRLRKRGQENVGRRVLADAEIRLFWDGIIEPEAARRTGLGLRLALLTGARVGEVAGINRAELSDIAEPANAAWLIPGTRTKNGRDHLIPLSPLAREIILELLAMLDASAQFLIPTRSGSRSGPMRSNSLTQAMTTYFASRIAGDSDAAKTWRADRPSPHDLRRTVETRLASMGTPKEIRDAILNHVTPGVGAKHYNLYDFAPEKRAALNRWSLMVSAILDPVKATVVDLADARRGR